MVATEYSNNPDAVIARFRYHVDPEYREKVQNINKEWHKKQIENPEYRKKHNDRNNEYNKNRYKTDPEFRARALNAAKKHNEQRKLNKKDVVEV